MALQKNQRRSYWHRSAMDRWLAPRRRRSRSRIPLGSVRRYEQFSHRPNGRQSGSNISWRLVGSTKWSDGINAVGYRNFAAPINHDRPQEAIILQRLSTLVVPPPAGSRRHPLSRYRGRTAMDMQNRRWKLFMDFCPYGSLHDVIAYHLDKGVNFPEPFIVSKLSATLTNLADLHDTSGTLENNSCWQCK